MAIQPMNQIWKSRPPRLERVFSTAPLYFVTFNTLLRRALLACGPVHSAFEQYAKRGIEFGGTVGRYVIMPDHVHLFVRISQELTLQRWESGLKQAMGKPLRQLGHHPTQVEGQRLCSFWEPGFVDHILRSDESYSEKWNYVYQNPVRAGLVTTPDAWPYQGEIFRIDRV